MGGTGTWLFARRHIARSALPIAVAIASCVPAWLGLASPVATAPTTSRQVDARQVPTFRSGVQLVAVYATVSDTSGRLLPDLPADAFQVFDNGLG